MIAKPEDQTPQILAILETSMGNPISKGILRSLSGNGNYRDGRNAIQHALEWYSGCRHPPSVSLILKALPVILLLDIGRFAFDVSHEDLAKSFKEPVVRRGLSNILRSIGEYGITRPQKLSSPFLVVWNFTNACNLNCKHCYQDAQKATPDELTLKEKIDLIDQFADADIVAVAFSGGEPMVHPHFWKVAEYAAQRGIFVAIATNGTLLTEENVKRLVDIGVGYAEISLDAATPEKHDEFRGETGCWQRTADGIARISRSGISTCVATTVTRDSYDELPAVIEKARELGAKRFIGFNFIPTGRGKQITDRDITPEMREEFMKHLFSYVGTGFEAFTTAPQFARVCNELSRGSVFSPTHFGVSEVAPSIRVLGDFIGGCGAGRMYCAVQPNGTVTPCVFIPIPVGNIREKRFVDIWRDSPLIQQLQGREHLKGTCGSCEFKTICGGCRARAYGYFGDVSATDPGCVRYMQAMEGKKQVPAEPEGNRSLMEIAPIIARPFYKIKSTHPIKKIKKRLTIR